MKQRLKQNLLLIGFGVALYAIFMHLSDVLTFLGNATSLFMPLIVGGVLAFVLNVPMRGIENLLNRGFARGKRRPPAGVLRMASLLLTLVAILVVIALIVTMIIPSLTQSWESIYALWQAKSSEWIELLKNYHIDAEWLADLLEYLPSWEELQSILSDLSSGVPNVIYSVAGAAASTVNAVATGVIAFVLALYFLIYKEVLARQSKKILYAYTKKSVADGLCYVASLVNQKYGSFLSGQCIEACILGGLMYLTFSISGLPYATLVAVLTGATSFIPYVGAFLSCGFVAVLIFMVSPLQALISIIVYQITQFIENQFIYPKVVGSSVGLSPFWTLLAVIVGGKLFGILGMIFFIPLTSVIYELLRNDVHHRLRKQAADRTD